jgi:dTMP kinase
MADGRFIVFEGIDGSGTTTQAAAAAKWLRRKEVDVVEVHEPTDGPLGKIIRQALKKQMPGREGEELEPELFALLFAADRLHHMYATVNRELTEFGRWVLSDRSYLSTFAYQSAGDLPLEWIRDVNRYVRRADVTFLLDLDPAVAHKRLSGRNLFTQNEVFETPEMMGKVRPNYLHIAEVLREEGENIVVIDAAQDAPAVAETIRETLAALL